MTLHVHRSTRVEDLVSSLDRTLREGWPADPLRPVPIVVGSSGMGRWLRHELATRARSASLLDFLYPRNAFDAAASWLLRPKDLTADPDAVFWDVEGRRRDAWSGSRLVGRVLKAIRDLLETQDFASVRRYLGQTSSGRTPVSVREVTFATQVARSIERLHYDRPHDALAWSSDPSSAPEDTRWLAHLVAHLERNEPDVHGPSPAALLGQVDPLPLGTRTRKRPLHVFGLSTLRPGDKLRLRVLARHLDVHLYLLVPSTAWWGDLRTKREQIRDLRRKLEHDGHDALVRSDLVELLGANELLAAHGGPSRDLQLWLEDADYIDHDCRREAVADASEPPTLLRELQRWVDRADPTPDEDDPPWRELEGCASVRIHACHGALRQCEALRDELLRMFAKDPTLEPRHVLVMTPDVASYAPLIAAVFSRRASGGSVFEADGRTEQDSPAAPAIAVQIADLGLSVTNPIAEALLRVLALTEERVTVTAILELLQLAPVRTRFGLEDRDLVDVREMLIGSGARWAWDSDDRLRFDQPKLDQNTLRFGLERLALGVLMPDDTDIDVLEATGALGPAAPFDVASRDRTTRFGQLASFMDTFDDVRRSLMQPATALEWLRRLRHAMNRLTLVEDDAAWQRVQVEDVLQERLGHSTDGELQLDRSALEALVSDAFEVQARGDRPVTSAVTVCAMEPMRSVPFRVIAMLGLDDRAFPRASKESSWDPFASPRPAEYDRRTLDRHLFLESILCARDALLLFGTGFEPLQGRPIPLSTVVTELSELLSRSTASTAMDWPTRKHPLQPWSEDAFVDRAKDRAPRPQEELPFDSVWFASRRAMLDGQSIRQEMDTAERVSEHAWPREQAVPSELTADALARALVNPSRELLRETLGIQLAEKAVETPSREPLELDGLEGWDVRDRLLSMLDEADARGELHLPESGRVALDAFEQRLRAEGTLPLHAGGRVLLARFADEVSAVFERARESGTRRSPVLASVVVDGLRLSAPLSDIRSLGRAGSPCEILLKTVQTAPNERTLLRAWLTLAIARAGGHDVDAVRILGTSREQRILAPRAASPAEAQHALADIVAVYRACRKHPVPLFPHFSFALAQQAEASPDKELEELLESCASHWNSSSHHRGAREDAWVMTLYPDFEVSDLSELPGLLDWTLRVWGPLVTELAARPQERPRGKSSPKGSPLS